MITVYSPLRISFAGGGTDISPFVEECGGAVTNTTIDRGITIRYIDDGGTLEVSSRDFLKTSLISSKNNSMETQIIELLTGNNIRTGRVILSGDVPPGSGLGSSSALINGLLKLIYTVNNVNRTAFEIAEESYSIEKNNFNIILGRQDPYAIAIGGLKFMEFHNGHQSVTKFYGQSEFKSKLERSLLLVYTGHTRESAAALKDQVTKSEAGDIETMKNLNSIRELAFDARDAIRNSNIKGLCRVINTGWNIKKSLGNNITNDRIDNIIETAFSMKADAARLLGGGSEGFILLLSDPSNINYLEESMMSYSDFVIRLKFDSRGTRVIQNF
ncbi:MAG: kinase [Ferroplasma sp.]